MEEVKEIFARRVRDKVSQTFSKGKAEDVFGLIVKKSGTEDADYYDADQYNIYDKETGELLITNLKSWEVDELFGNISYDISQLLQDKAVEEDDMERVNVMEEYLSGIQDVYEQKYYKKCPVCGETYDSKHEVHFHVKER